MTTETQTSINSLFLIIDDHDILIEGTINILKQAYPEVKIISCKTAEETRLQLEKCSPALIVADLSIPESSTELSQVNTGVDLLKELLESHSEHNFVVQSAHSQALIRIKRSIEEHQGGFAVVDKRLPKQDLLDKVAWALQGIIYTPPEMRRVLAMKPEWVTVLKLAFEEHLQDKEIARRMHIRERTVRNYWTKIQNAFGIYPEEGINTRIRTGAYAREKGLIN